MTNPNQKHQLAVPGQSHLQVSPDPCHLNSSPIAIALSPATLPVNYSNQEEEVPYLVEGAFQEPRIADLAPEMDVWGPRDIQRSIQRGEDLLEACGPTGESRQRVEAQTVRLFG